MENVSLVNTGNLKNEILKKVSDKWQKNIIQFGKSPDMIRSSVRESYFKQM